MAEDEQRAFGGEHIDFDADLGGDAVAPDAAGVDDEAALDGDDVARRAVLNLDAGDTAVRHRQVDDFVVG